MDIRKKKGFRISMFALLLCFSTLAKGQTDTLIDPKPSFSFGLQVHSGFIIPHTESIRSISYSSPWAIEADLAWHYSDTKSQSYCNCLPRLGLSFMYINFDNPSILGHGLTMAPYAEPFISLGRKWNISIRFSAGAVYLSNVFHPVTNPDNLFYSTHFSFILTLNPVLNYQLSPNWNLRIGGNYNHISNGGNHQPNKGINFPTASFGFDYIFHPVDFSQKAVQSIQVTRKNSLNVLLLGTVQIPFQETNNRKLLYGFNATYGRSITRLSMLTAGAEFVNDGALKTELKRNDSTPPDHKRIAILAGHELQIGKFSFSQQLGIYIYAPFKAMDPLYQRWGLDYHLSDRLFIGTNLKAHRQIADFLDVRIGFKFF